MYFAIIVVKPPSYLLESWLVQRLEPTLLLEITQIIPANDFPQLGLTALKNCVELSSSPSVVLPYLPYGNCA